MSEAKLDSPFSVGKFMIKCYCTRCRLNRIQNKGLLFCVPEDILCTILNKYISGKSMEIRRNELKIDKIAPIKFIQTKYKLNS